MKKADINAIENALGVTLPKGYVEFMLNYPKDLQGRTAQKEFINDPERLLNVNRNVRAYNKRQRSKPGAWVWPEHLFVVGESSMSFLNDDYDEEKACYAIDLRKPRPKIMHVSIVSGMGCDDSVHMYTLREFASLVRELDEVEPRPTKAARNGAKGTKAGRAQGGARAKSKRRSMTAAEVFAHGAGPEFGKALWNWTESRYQNLGYEKLTEGEQLLWRIRWLLLEINGNSFPGFYENTPDDWPLRVPDDLKRVGAKKAAAALTRVGKKLFGGDVPPTKTERSDALLALEKAEERFERVLRECDRIWSQHGEEIPERCVMFAAGQPELFGVEPAMR